MQNKNNESPSCLTVTLEGLDVICVIGSDPRERLTEQALEVNVEFAPQQLKCTESDHLPDAIDYTQVVETCLQVARSGQYHLLEALAYATVKALLAKYPISWVRLKVRKKRPLPHLGASGVEVLMHRQ